MKFIIIGVVSTLINYGVFFALYSWFDIHYVVSSGIGYVIGLLVGYLFNRNWTFTDDKSDEKTKEFVLYIAVYGVSLLLSLGTIALLVDSLAWNPLLANVIAIGVSTITNFVGLKFFVFKHSHAAIQ